MKQTRCHSSRTALFGCVLTWAGLIQPVAAETSLAAVPAARPAVLKADAFRHYVDTFNQNDRELYVQHIPNAAAWDFLRNNIPLLDCPDKDIEEIYYFRWWTFRKHIKQTPDGFVITEFLPPVGWAGKYNTINCAAGHHLHEGRWLNDPQYLDDYSLFWFRKGGDPRRYSFWAADAIWARFQVTGDDRLPEGAAARPGRRITRRGKRLIAIPTACSGRWTTATAWKCPSAARCTRNSRATGRRSTATCMAMPWPSPGSPSGPARKQLAEQFRAKAADAQAARAGETLGPAGAVLQGAAARREHPLVRCPRGARLHALVLQPARRRTNRSPGSRSWIRSGFYAPFGPTTAEQRHPQFAVAYTGHECQWNGPSWPFSTAVTLTALANLLNQYQQDVVSRKDYFDLLKIYTRSHHLKLRRWPRGAVD